MKNFKTTDDVQNIIFKVSSDKDIIQIPDLSESIDIWFEAMPPEIKYAACFKIEILVENHSGFTTNIGFVEGTYFEPEQWQFDVDSFLYLCDAISGELYGMAESVTTQKGSVKHSICPPDRSIMYIDRIYIEEEYRKCGIGTYIFENLSALMRRSLNWDPYVCILTPYTQIKLPDGTLTNECEDMEVKKAKLIQFYKQIGFTQIKNSDYMYKKI